MEEKVLTREEIALQVLCAAISASSDSSRHTSEYYLPEDENGALPMVQKAFRVADVFIRERNRQD